MKSNPVITFIAFLCCLGCAMYFISSRISTIPDPLPNNEIQRQLSDQLQQNVRENRDKVIALDKELKGASPSALLDKNGLEDSRLTRAENLFRLKQYNLALQEYAEAIDKEPSNINAHLGFNKILISLGQFERASEGLANIRRLSKGKEYDQQKLLLEEEILSKVSPPVGNGELSIFEFGLLKEVGGKASILAMKKLMAVTDTRTADSAENILTVLAPTEVRPTLLGLLTSADKAIQLRIAKRLWKEDKNEEAGKVLSEVTSELLKSSSLRSNGVNPQEKGIVSEGLKDIKEIGYKTGKAFYLEVINNSKLYNWPLVLGCIQEITAEKDLEMKDPVKRMLVQNEWLNDHTKIIGYSPIQEALEFLAITGDKTYVPKLKAALANAFQYEEYKNQCEGAVELLTKFEGKKWQSFYHWYWKGGWSEKGKILSDINKLRGDWGGSGKPVIDHSPEDSNSINQFLELLGPKNRFSNSGNTLAVKLVEVIDADRMRWLVNIMEGSSENPLYEANLIFRGTGLAENAWLITKASGLKSINQAIGGSASTYLKSGKQKLEHANFSGAIADFTKGILWDSKSDELYLYRGYAKFKSQDFDGAISDEDRAIQLKYDPDKNAYNVRGYAKFEKGNFDGAIADHNHALSIDSENTNAYIGRGDAKFGKGDYSEALTDYKKAIDINPSLKEELNSKINRVKSKLQ